MKKLISLLLAVLLAAGGTLAVFAEEITGVSVQETDVEYEQNIKVEYDTYSRLFFISLDNIYTKTESFPEITINCNGEDKTVNEQFIYQKLYEYDGKMYPMIVFKFIGYKEEPLYYGDLKYIEIASGAFSDNDGNCSKPVKIVVDDNIKKLSFQLSCTADVPGYGESIVMKNSDLVFNVTTESELFKVFESDVKFRLSDSDENQKVLIESNVSEIAGKKYNFEDESFYASLIFTDTYELDYMAFTALSKKSLRVNSLKKALSVFGDKILQGFRISVLPIIGAPLVLFAFIGAIPALFFGLPIGLSMIAASPLHSLISLIKDNIIKTETIY